MGGDATRMRAPWECAGATSALLEQRLELHERAVGLALRDPANEHAGGRLAEEAARRDELVLVLEVRPAAVAVGELVRRAGVGVCGTASLPRGGGVGLELGELPLDLEVGAAQAQGLLHPVALVQLAAVDVVHLAVDRDPLVEAPGIEHGLEDLRARRVDVDRCRHQRHLAATSSVSSHSRSARSTAASNECNRIPNAAAAASSRGSRSCSRPSISGSMRAGSSPATAAANCEAIGVSVKPSPSLGRPTIIDSAIRSMSCS